MSIASDLARLLCQSHPVDAARTLERLTVEAAVQFLESVAPTVAAGVLAATEPGRAADCLTRCSTPRAADVLAALPPQAAVRVLQRLDPPQRQSLIERVRPDVAAVLRRALDYRQGTAGASMDPDVVTFPDDERCGEALRRLRRLRHRVRYYVYVTDRDQRLVGVVTLRDLMHAPPSQPLASLARRPVTSLHVRDSHSNVLRHTGWRLFHALPVVDDSDIVVGIVRYETLRRLEAETTDEPAPSMMAVGTALGQTWLALATVLLDGFAGSLSVSREANESKEVRDG